MDSSPINTISNAELILDHRLRRWTYIKGTLKSSKNRWFYFDLLIWPYDVNMSIDQNYKSILICVLRIYQLG